MCRSLWELLRGRVMPKAARRWGGFFHNDAEHRDFTAIGTAAGNAPPHRTAKHEPFGLRSSEFAPQSNHGTAAGLHHITATQ